MAASKINIQLQLKIIYSLFFFIMLLEISISIFFPSVLFAKLAAIITLIGVLPLLYITFKELKSKDEESVQNKQKLKNIFDTLDVAIWSHDLKSDTLLITPGIEKLYGYSYIDF